MKKSSIIILITFISVLLIISTLNWYINLSARKIIYNSVKDIPPCYTALVLGAMVSSTGEPSSYLRDRLDKAFELYKEKKVKRLLLSGDHGQQDYDEVNSMRVYLLNKGVDTNDIFLDHAGFDTYNSIVRAGEIFEVEDMIIVSQEFHLSRALFIACKKGHKAYGIVADKTPYEPSRNRIREKFANIKAVLEIILNRKPRFLGDKIPITGNSRLSYDR